MWILYSLLSSAAWASVNILDSVLVNKYDKYPIALMWFGGVFKLCIILSFFLILPVYTAYWGMLFACGVILYVVALLYFHILQRIDTSVTQSAWAIESIILSVAGVIFFAEHWTIVQTIGVVLILIGVFVLTYWHQQLSVLRSAGLLVLLGVVGAPTEFGLKYATLHGVSPLLASFWFMSGSVCVSLLVPLFAKKTLRQIKEILTESNQKFYICIFFNGVLGFVGSLSVIKAFSLGPLSLVTIASNVQPFLVILFAWLLSKTTTTHIPKEILTRQSISVKLICFSLVFGGLALFAITE